MARVSLHGLGKRFDNVEAVRDVNLEIADGEFVVLVGPSGCGKSTTLRIIAGLEESTSGEVRFGDRVVNDLTPRERNIAMVFQSYALYPHMTVERNMGFALEQDGTSKGDIRETVRKTAELLGIGELLERKPKALSGGQRQRVAMGRAIVRRPEVFLFDEPLSNLDAALRTQMRMEIKKLHRLLKTTVVYVTHDQIEAMTLADRIVVMDRGEIVQVGTPMEVYERPKTRFVAGFIGAPRMNFVPAAVGSNSVGDLTLAIPGTAPWRIPNAHRARFAMFAGGPVELGIRPEHFMEQAGPESALLSALPDVVEPTGADTLVHFPVGGADVVARSRPERRIAVGEPLAFAVDFSRIYAIDPASGRIDAA
ncbi:Maltose/maltodextrin import ATP-binding protein MalK [Usitatibacter rugosus]|uniref:Maltose/maltodextrin import ATP-binding protein MalK n=1 Tax=Usitatibacter rugosus TaxID=2732067 RepID=A0A6M4GT07_9PROT|nr:sn-glycerol-3-phosphate ABC transporter ATP-binding protein UgpC [Usitatibacter rugosus]QJR09614.1 Maltose/maltodextrin import ATP-binding protein MalK [Usitatibacter rugosus]